ncbi:MAG TPA: metallophosphoesterase family protein [Thermomicrobiales bacterium]|jgi:predicted phosphodiesterase
MRVAIIADIHGNALALDAVLADLGRGGYDHLVCLGDAIQGGPQPALVVARLRSLGCPTVLGNADAYLLTGAETGAEPLDDARRRRLAATRDWSLTRLSDADRAFIAAFPLTVELALPGDLRLRCAHGTPASFDEILLPTTPDDELVASLAPDGRTLHVGGHTHVQFVRQFPDRTFFANPGSVGLAWRHGQPPGIVRADPWAEYAILDVAEGRVELSFRRIPFDVAAYRAIIHASDAPHAADLAAQYIG